MKHDETTPSAPAGTLSALPQDLSKIHVQQNGSWAAAAIGPFGQETPYLRHVQVWRKLVFVPEISGSHDLKTKGMQRGEFKV